MTTNTPVHTHDYLPGMDLPDYLGHLRRHHPEVATLVDPDRLADLGHEPWLAEGNEFDDDTDTGRGVSYRRAQRRELARVHGIRRLFGVLGGPDRAGFGGHLLDVLGGDGLLARVWRRVTGSAADAPTPLITSDISGEMVRTSLRAGLPAVRQRAHELVLRDGVLGGVLLAYGTHHLTVDERAGAAVEARRVLRPGGRVALHDFDEGGAVSRFFSEVVAPYSRHGHPYPHFTASEMLGYLDGAGLVDVDVRPMYDPVVVEGDTADDALAGLAGYMADMYGLVLLTRGGGDGARRRVLDALDDVFRYDADDLPADAPDAVGRITVHHDGPGYRAELPRVALLATATRR